jgi:hypothetical protein
MTPDFLLSVGLPRTGIWANVDPAITLTNRHGTGQSRPPIAISRMVNFKKQHF